MAVGLQFFLGEIPPLPKGGRIEDLWRERSRNLIQRRTSTVIPQNIAHQGYRIFLSLFPNSSGICNFASRMCSAGIGWRVSAAYWACMTWPFLD